MPKIFGFVLLTLSLKLALSQKCFTPKNISGTCKKPLECQEIAELMKLTHRTPENIAFLRNSRSTCGYQGNRPLVCCSNLPQPPQCGIQLIDKIHGGQKANIHEFPWSAILMYETLGQVAPGCGGSLLSSKHVLSAAHCVTGLRSGRNLLKVRLGEHDTRTGSDCDTDIEICTTHKDFEIDTIFVHKDYSARYRTNDIALLRLLEEVTFSDHIQPICLPTKSVNYDHKNLSVAGWGRTENLTDSSVKLKVNIPVIPHEDCVRIYGRQRFPQEIISHQMCAGGVVGKDSCAGDSGGPLMVNDKEDFPHWQVVGIVSFGPNACGKEGVPGVYTKVFDYIDWIYKNVEPYIIIIFI